MTLPAHTRMWAIGTLNRRRSSSPVGVWTRSTLIGAVLLTACDAVLLQKSKSFFTGGFLSGLPVSGPLEATGFLIVSVLVDAALLGLLVAVILAFTSRLRLTDAARTLFVVGGSLLPLVYVNVVSYRLLTYLGETFDLALMFELTGRRPSEIWAVGSSQIVPMLMLGIGAATGVGVMGWMVNRFARGTRRTLPGALTPVVKPACAVFLAGLAVVPAVGAVSESIEDGLGRKPSGRVFEIILEAATDVDRDGFGLTGGMRDNGLFDAAVYPWAIDVPGNGVDEDGVAGDLPADVSAYSELQPAGGAWERRPSVVLFVLESFRADSVGRIVNGKPVTPVLSRLSREGISTDRAYSHNGYTAQSRFHLLSGSLAGIRGGTSLIDDFARNGYQTAYFSAQDESFGGEAYGVGFSRADVSYDARRDRDRRYSDYSTPGSLAVSYETLQQRVVTFLENRQTTKPLFLYVNFHDTHYPYHHEGIAALVSDSVVRRSEISPRKRQALEEMYLNTVANVDRAVGLIVQNVERTLGEAPAVIVTADHGESLFDENFLGHGYALNDAQTRVPLILRGIPIHISEPFGQVELRDAISAALTAQTESARITQEPDKKVFQYLGKINSPRQIGLVTNKGRIIYDFRTRRVRTSDSAAWRTPEELSVAERTPLITLVRFWEKMMLARAGR